MTGPVRDTGRETPTDYEWRACVGDYNKPMDDSDGPFVTRDEAEAALPGMQGDPAYEVMWIERRVVGEWEIVDTIDIPPLRPEGRGGS